MRSRHSLLISFLVLTVISACLRDSHPKPSGTSKRWVLWATESASNSLDWNQCHDRSCLQSVSMIMEGLTRIEISDKGVETTPALAERWEFLSPTQIRFTLRKGIRWTDGEPLRPGDFTAAWKQSLRHCDLSNHGSGIWSVVGARAFCEGKAPWSAVGIQTGEDRSLLFTLKSPDPTILIALSHPSLWPVREAKTPQANPPTLGAFLIERWERGRLIRFAANPSYYGGAPRIAGVEMRVVVSPSIRTQLFLDGEVDLADPIPDSHLPLISSNPGLAFFPTLDAYALVFHPLRRPFQTLDGRRALAKVIQRSELASLVSPTLTPSTQLLFPSARADSAGTQTAVAEAKKALDALRADLQLPLRLGIRSSPTSSAPQMDFSTAENLQAQWQRQLELKVETASTAKTVGTAHPISFSILTFRPDPYHPLRNLDRLLAGGDFSPASRSRLIESAIQSALGASDLGAWNRALETLENRLVSEESLVLPLAFRRRAALRNPRLTGLGQNAVEIWDFRYTSKD